jgi:large subunit ribosomal protein L1
MPSLKSKTITTDFEKSIIEFNNGQLNYKMDKYSNLHLVIGNTNFSTKNLKENFLFIIEHLRKNKPSNVKGKYFNSVHICTSMSPSVNLDLN